ncbi:GntR family transcriptional regulator [Coraliomargarita algicola]|uniref:GntR family transcriptional regulator n=1 Tax=Coraliomargarita algicola TaxID=3092156 RepID=A0ABZ0RPB4_9BACT|nr:GntR family transcriptional regulator [Coraliomargarita sp. J2-16]WPJ97952.1 GntR family transcriptional regulator [Coraliomargarita sp. J2-16]
MLPFSIHIEDGAPVSEQLTQAVRRAILKGDLQDGDRFPSVRSLSVELRISPTTAHKAVSVLKSEGLLGSQPGVGMVVRTDELPSTNQRLEQLSPALKQILTEAKSLQLSDEMLCAHIQKLWKEHS